MHTRESVGSHVSVPDSEPLGFHSLSVVVLCQKIDDPHPVVDVLVDVVSVLNELIDPWLQVLVV